MASPQQGDECGICHDSILEVRGIIDSCEHTFCYPCISKWSSIESRCPYCRLRFNFIRKSSAQGVVLAEETVPVRDQRAIFENRDFIDWLESVRCVVCNGSEAEDQLMLCDGCDQACHTFCVGLDAVPDDAWYCLECAEAQRAATAAATSTDMLVDTDSPIGRTRRHLNQSRVRVTRIDTDSESSGSGIEETPQAFRPLHRQRPRVLLLDTESDDNENEHFVGLDTTGTTSIVDLTSPMQTVPPHVLDLRSRLRAQLLRSNGDSGNFGISPSTTPQSPIPRSLGFATTVSDFTFAANVAAGRRTTTPTPRSTNRPFAQRAQDMVRERFMDIMRVDLRGPGEPNGSEIVDLCDTHEGGTRHLCELAVVASGPGMESGTCRSARCNQHSGDLFERERVLRRVQVRMEEKFAGITLPSGMITAVQATAVDLVVEDTARWSIDTEGVGSTQLLDDAIDEALTKFNSSMAGF